MKIKTKKSAARPATARAPRASAIPRMTMGAPTLHQSQFDFGQTPSAPYAEGVRAATTTRKKYAVSSDPADTWYNMYFSMHSELEIPLPRLPATCYQVQRTLGCQGVAVGSVSVAAGATAVLFCNPHSGDMGAGLPAPGYMTSDFGVVTYASNASKFSDFAYTDATDYLAIGDVDFTTTATAMVYNAIPWVGGLNPREMLTPNTPFGNYVLLGASMAIEAATDINGKCVVGAVDCNQNPRLYGSDKIAQLPGLQSSNGYTSTIAGSGCEPNMLGWQPMYLQDPTVANPVPSTFMNSFRKIAIGGNSRAYSYAQIPGDTYWQNRGLNLGGVALTGTDRSFTPSFPVYNAWQVMLASKGLIIVSNTGSTAVTFNVRCSAVYGTVVDPTVGAYSQAYVPSPHHVPNMDYLCSADVGSTPEEVYQKVKREMASKVADHNSHQAAFIAANALTQVPRVSQRMSTSTVAHVASRDWVKTISDAVSTAIGFAQRARPYVEKALAMM